MIERNPMLSHSMQIQRYRGSWELIRAAAARAEAGQREGLGQPTVPKFSQNRPSERLVFR